jgi:hypothetical protein
LITVDPLPSTNKVLEVCFYAINVVTNNFVQFPVDLTLCGNEVIYAGGVAITQSWTVNDENPWVIIKGASNMQILSTKGPDMLETDALNGKCSPTVEF